MNQEIKKKSIIDDKKTCCFKSITQLDKSNDHVYKEYPQSVRGVAGTIFSVVTATEFMQNNDVSIDKHEENVRKAVSYSARLGINNEGKTIEDVFKLTTIFPQTASKTTTTSIEKHLMDISSIIPDVKTKTFCTIIRKNNRFFVILADKTTSIYCVRDCNEELQWNFRSYDELIKHLDVVYTFTTSIVIDGMEMEEYSKIEYIVITQKFDTKFEPQKEGSIKSKISETSASLSPRHDKKETVFMGYRDEPHTKIMKDMNPINKYKGGEIIGVQDCDECEYIDEELQNFNSDELNGIRVLKGLENRMKFDEINGFKEINKCGANACSKFVNRHLDVREEEEDENEEGDIENEEGDSDEEFDKEKTHDGHKQSKTRSRPKHYDDEDEDFFKDD